MPTEEWRERATCPPPVFGVSLEGEERSDGRRRRCICRPLHHLCAWIPEQGRFRRCSLTRSLTHARAHTDRRWATWGSHLTFRCVLISRRWLRPLVEQGARTPTLSERKKETISKSIKTESWHCRPWLCSYLQSFLGTILQPEFELARAIISLKTNSLVTVSNNGVGGRKSKTKKTISPRRRSVISCEWLFVRAGTYDGDKIHSSCSGAWSEMK